MKSINLEKLPFLVRVGFFISNIGYIIHNYGFKESVSKIWSLVKISLFKFCYKRSKLFRRRTFRNLSKLFTDPFCVYLLILLFNDIDDFFDEEKINQYVAENNISEKDTVKIKSKLWEFKNSNEAQS